MTKNKIILAAILLLALIPLTANATITRVQGLGGDGAAFIIRDAYTPNIWPELAVDFARLAGCEFGSYVSSYSLSGDTYYPVSSWGFNKAYIFYDFGADNGVLSFALDKVGSPKYLMGPSRLLTVDGAYNRLSFIYGRPLGDVKVGLGINYAGKSYKKDETAANADDAIETSYSTFGIRLGGTALDNNLDVALGVELAMFDDKNDGAKTELKNDGSMSIAFAGRYWYHANDRYALIPNVKFSMIRDANTIDDKSGSSTETESEGYTATEFAFGLGNNWKPVENMLAIFEVGILAHMDKYEYEYNSTSFDTSVDYTNSQFNIYWRLGFETKIFEWMNGRFGAERTWRGLTKEWMYDTSNEPIEATGKPQYGSAFTNTYLGATVHWNRLYLDMLVEPLFMNNGPYFISGSETTLFSRVSLYYKFKE